MKAKLNEVIYTEFLSFLKHIPIINTIKTYKKGYIKSDLIASLTVAVIAIPQSMAYAIIAGVKPVYGLYTAIVSTIFSSLFGSSDHLIGGATNALSLLVASNMKNFMGRENAYEMLFLMTFVVGILQFLFGVMKLGKVINYVSHAVIVGFTAGAGVIIALGQLSQLLGISLGKDYMSLMTKVYFVIIHINKSNIYALGLGLLTIAVILICKRINKNLPGSLMGLVLSIIVVMVFSLDKYGVKLTGNIPGKLPPFRMVNLNMSSTKEIFSGALAIAIIGLVESISISKSIASTSHQKIDANQEFLGQGLSNIIASFFQCFPGGGSFTRSAINYYSGAVTRISGVLSGVIVAVILIFLAPFAQYIPSASLAGVIMLIAYNMVNKKEMKKVYNIGKTDSLVMWVTFGATVLMPDLDWAIYMGIIISIILYLKDTSTVQVKILVPSQDEEYHFRGKEIDPVEKRVDILTIQLPGNLYFGSAYDLENKLDSLVGKARIFVLRMNAVSTIDVTALDALKVFIRRVKDSGDDVIVSGVKSGLNHMLLNSNLTDEIGRENIFLSEDEIFASSVRAIERAKKLLES